MTSRVCLPMEPVDPQIAILFRFTFYLHTLNNSTWDS
jgi:hypothetical protein